MNVSGLSYVRPVKKNRSRGDTLTLPPTPQNNRYKQTAQFVVVSQDRFTSVVGSFLCLCVLRAGSTRAPMPKSLDRARSRSSYGSGATCTPLCSSAASSGRDGSWVSFLVFLASPCPTSARSSPSPPSRPPPLLVLCFSAKLVPPPRFDWFTDLVLRFGFLSKCSNCKTPAVDIRPTCEQFDRSSGTSAVVDALSPPTRLRQKRCDVLFSVRCRVSRKRCMHALLRLFFLAMCLVSRTDNSLCSF